MNLAIHLRRSRPNRVRYSWSIVSLLTALAFLLNVGTSVAEPIIKNLDVVRGELTFTEVSGALSYRVEWSATMAPGSWSREAPGVPLIQPIGAGDRTVEIGIIRPPCFYRVVAVLESVVLPPPVGFSLIPAGQFQMGDALDGEVDAPVRTVNVSAFYMGKTEVTKAEWDEVLTWGLTRGYTDLAIGRGRESNYPVHSVTWWDLIKWCNARSEKDGLAPVYTVNGAIMRTGSTEPTANWSANGYRLPTEAEWEKAARGGLNGKRFPWGDTISHSQANYTGDSSYAYDVSPTEGFHPVYMWGDFPVTSPVGSFVANGYGLYDMVGNVFEWCWDWYGIYAAGAQTDPKGARSGSKRVCRGGGFGDDASFCGVGIRGWNCDPSITYLDGGFRTARGL
jgi:formylglycine-generating enzyme required for sulfatase activity